MEDKCAFCWKDRSIAYYGSARTCIGCIEKLVAKGYGSMVSFDRPHNQRPNQSLIGTTVESLERTIFGGVQITSVDAQGAEYVMVLEQDSRYPGWVGTELRAERTV